MDRGVSTVVDGALALLLVSASVVALVAATPPAPQHHPDDARRATVLLTTTTVSIDYRGGNASGTVAGLLADAPLAGTPAGYVDAVRKRATDTVDAVDSRAQVVATPHNGTRRVVVGETPPPSVDVSAFSFVVRPRTVDGTRVRIVVRAWSR